MRKGIVLILLFLVSMNVYSQYTKRSEPKVLVELSYIKKANPIFVEHKYYKSIVGDLLKKDSISQDRIIQISNKADLSLKQEMMLSEELIASETRVNNLNDKLDLSDKKMKTWRTIGITSSIVAILLTIVVVR